MLAQIGYVLPRFRVYENIYRNHEQLLAALAKVYLDVLQFCTRTKTFILKLKRSMCMSVYETCNTADAATVPLSIVMKGAWKPLRQDFDQQIIAFRTHSRQIEEEARLAHRIEAAHMYEIQLANQALQVRNDMLGRRHNILTAIPSADYIGKYSRLLNLKHPGTNTWFQSANQYTAWKSAPTSDCLCCYGIPGSGKSVLAASVVQDLNTSQTHHTSIVCHYYCDYADVASLDPSCMIASLTKQVVQRLPLDKFTRDFESPFDDNQTLPVTESVAKFLLRILQCFDTVYVVLDGVDEVPQGDQPAVLSLIQSVLNEHRNLKIFVTSRTEEYQIRQALSNYGTIRLSPDCLQNDIAQYVRDFLGQADATSPLSLNSSLKQEVVEALVVGANGM